MCQARSSSVRNRGIPQALLGLGKRTICYEGFAPTWAGVSALRLHHRSNHGEIPHRFLLPYETSTGATAAGSFGRRRQRIAVDAMGEQPAAGLDADGDEERQDQVA